LEIKDSGSGNQVNFLSGFTYTIVISKSLLIFYIKTVAMPNDVQAPGRLRNIQDDPFAVRGNRETVAGELL
jgi:hypothetical protein